MMLSDHVSFTVKFYIYGAKNDSLVIIPQRYKLEKRNSDDIKYEIFSHFLVSWLKVRPIV